MTHDLGSCDAHKWMGRLDSPSKRVPEMVLMGLLHGHLDGPQRWVPKM